MMKELFSGIETLMVKSLLRRISEIGIAIMILIIMRLFLGCENDNTETQPISMKIDSYYKLEKFDSPERRKKIIDLIKRVEYHQMNPDTKKTVSDFAVDTFKIEHFQRLLLYKNWNMEDNLKVQKSTCVMYDSLNEKYFNKLKNTLKNQDLKDLLISQSQWEKSKETEFKIFKRLIKEGLDPEFNFYKAYEELLKMRLNLLYFYYIQFIESRYRSALYAK